MATQHSHGPNWGRRVPGCPRCAELDAGAEPRGWGTSVEREREDDRSRREVQHRRIERAYAQARAQVDTCCALRVESYRLSRGAVRAVTVRGCPRHGSHTATLRPVLLQGRQL